MIIDVVFSETYSTEKITEVTRNFWDVEELICWQSSFLTSSLLLTIYPATIHITSFEESETVIQKIIEYLSILFKNMVIAISSSTIIDPFLKIKDVSVINITPNG